MTHSLIGHDDTYLSIPYDTYDAYLFTPKPPTSLPKHGLHVMDDVVSALASNPHRRAQ